MEEKEMSTDSVQEESTPPQAPEPKLEKAPAPAPASSRQEKTKPNRVQRFFRALLIWIIVIAFAFLAGFLTDHFMRYQPLKAELAQAQTELKQAQQELEQVQSLKDQIESLESDSQQLTYDLVEAQAHLEMLQVLVDINAARLALFLDDVEAAKEALTETPTRLDDLKERINVYDPTLAESMPQRLGLILGGLDKDVETAKIDLDLLAKNLIEVESAIFDQ